MELTKSKIFRQYNRVKAAAKRNAGSSVRFDPKRIDRALGILMRGSYDFERYNTTISSCECPDQFYRPEHVCKHRLALILQRRATK